MSESNSRDTQFTGFAKKLLEELLSVEDVYIDTANRHWREEWSEIIARRAYDLACHVATHTISSAHGDMSKIPDMKEFPEQSKDQLL